MPEVSVIIPAYNAEKYIEQCIRSVLDQTLTDFELIVVDDGSTDSTPDKVRELAGEDERVSLILQQNQYAGVARNNGMSHASGKYLYFLDADDYIAPNLLESMVARMVKTAADVVVCRSRHYYEDTGESAPIDYALTLVDTSKVYNQQDLSDVMFRFCVGWPWDKLFKADFVAQHGLQYKPSRSSNDAYFVFCALMLAQQVAFVPEELVYHRTHLSTSIESTRSKSPTDALRAMRDIHQKIEEEDGLGEIFSRSYWNWVALFSVWNLRTLKGEPFDEYRDIFLEEFYPKIPMDDPDYFYNYTDWEGVRAIAKSHKDMYGELVWKQRDDLNTHRELWDTQARRDQAKKDLVEKVDPMEAELADLRNRITAARNAESEARREYGEVLNSRTFKAGEKLAAPLNAARKMKQR